nr:isochorismatase family protein [Paracoccus sp. S-4012]
MVLIDLQERLVPAMLDGDQMVEAARKLMAGSDLLGRPVLATEQSPNKLGGTVAPLPLPSPAIAKMDFDASTLILDRAAPDDTLVVAGCETHICVLQTVAGLLRAGRKVVVAADAVSSRKALDRDTALTGMRSMGAEISTAEAILFGWIGGADHPQFREVSRLIK